MGSGRRHKIEVAVAEETQDQNQAETSAPDVDEQVAAGRKFMTDYREAFEELAK